MARPFLTTSQAVGAEIRRARTAAGLSQAQLAARAGVGRRFVVDVESGHDRAELGKVLVLLDVLDVFLVSGEVSPIAHRLEDAHLEASTPHRVTATRTPSFHLDSVLYAYAGRRRVGMFAPNTAGEVEFAYDDAAGPTPVSLTLPRHGAAEKGAALAHLDRLLPTSPEVRERWAKERGLADTHPMTLLAEFGEDLPGALTLSQDPTLPTRAAPAPVEATRQDIAARIAALRNQPTAWLDPRVAPKMSLSGRTGKFALARVRGRWFWPTYEVPSTHILRAARPDDEQVTAVLGQRMVVTERFDRRSGLRIHAERLPDGSHVLLAGDTVTPVA
ncbi:MAG: HipA N-terminal domain-containing protein [Microbacterium sp.]